MGGASAFDFLDAVTIFSALPALAFLNTAPVLSEVPAFAAAACTSPFAAAVAVLGLLLLLPGAGLVALPLPLETTLGVSCPSLRCRSFLMAFLVDLTTVRSIDVNELAPVFFTGIGRRTTLGEGFALGGSAGAAVLSVFKDALFFVGLAACAGFSGVPGPFDDALGLFDPAFAAASFGADFALWPWSADDGIALASLAFLPFAVSIFFSARSGLHFSPTISKLDAAAGSVLSDFLLRRELSDDEAAGLAFLVLPGVLPVLNCVLRVDRGAGLSTLTACLTGPSTPTACAPLFHIPSSVRTPFSTLYGIP